MKCSTQLDKTPNHEVSLEITSIAIDAAVADKLGAAISVLAGHGFSIAATQGGGAMMVAEFRSDTAKLLIVKDRGFWHITGETDDLKRYPSRKSLRAATEDAVDWITRRNS